MTTIARCPDSAPHEHHLWQPNSVIVGQKRCPGVAEPMTASKVAALWECPDCAFGFDSIHTDPDGGYSCPLCGEIAAEAEVERLRGVVARVEALARYRIPSTMVGVLNGLPKWMPVPTAEVVRWDDVRNALRPADD